MYEFNLYFVVCNLYLVGVWILFKKCVIYYGIRLVIVFYWFFFEFND